MERDQHQDPQSAIATSFALSDKTVTVLEGIARGYSYEQIVHNDPSLTYREIFDAAHEVLCLINGERPSPGGFEQVRKRHPHAYERWTAAEEEQLRTLIQQGETVARIAGALGRQRGAIRSRIIRLGWVELLSAKEQERFKRIMERQPWPPAETQPEHPGEDAEEPAHGE